MSFVRAYLHLAKIYHKSLTNARGRARIVTEKGGVTMLKIRRRTKDFITKIVLTVIGIGVASIPLDFYLLLKYTLEPHGVFQNLLLAGIGIYFFGVTQIVLCLLLMVWLVFVWLAE